MERLCKSCGTLVTGEGKFCPSCGGELESAVDLSKPVNEVQNTASPADNVANPYVAPVSSVPVASNTTYNTAGNQGTMPNYTNVNVNLTAPVNNDEMSLKDWIWTLVIPYLVGCITCGIGQFIMWIVWACSNSIPVAKKRFAQAQLVLMAVSVVLVILIYVIYFVFIFGIMGLSMADILSDMPNY